MSQKWNLLIPLVLCLATESPATAQETTDLPFYLPTPQGWRTETIPLPLDFAPELEYEGLEELRFSPGMFAEIEVDFWSYAFIWWVPEETHFDAERLRLDLESYFRGLMTAVAKAREFDPGEPEYVVELEAVESSSSDHAQWQGTVSTYDAFTTRKPIKLGVRIEIVPCPSQGHVAAFFQLSPQPIHHRIWEVMAEMRSGFRCARHDSASGS